MYEASRGEAQPNQDNMIRVLQEEFKAYLRVYLIIDGWNDATDEVEMQLEILLRRLDADNVSTMVTSRYAEIESATCGISCSVCHASNLSIYFQCYTASNMTFAKTAWINKNPAVIHLTSSRSRMTRFRSWSKQPTMKFEDILNGNWRSRQNTTRRGAEISELVVSRSAQRHLHEDSSRNHHSSRKYPTRSHAKPKAFIFWQDFTLIL